MWTGNNTLLSFNLTNSNSCFVEYEDEVAEVVSDLSIYSECKRLHCCNPPAGRVGV